MGILFSCWFKCLGKGDHSDTDCLIEETNQDDYLVDEVNSKTEDASHTVNKKITNQTSLDEDKTTNNSTADRPIDEVDNKWESTANNTDKIPGQETKNINSVNKFSGSSEESLNNSISDSGSIKQSSLVVTANDLICHHLSNLDGETQTLQKPSTLDQKNILRNLTTPNSISMEHENNHSKIEKIESSRNDIGNHLSKEFQSIGSNSFYKEENLITNESNWDDNNKNALLSEQNKLHMDSTTLNKEIYSNTEIIVNSNEAGIEKKENEKDLIIPQEKTEKSLQEIFISVNKGEQEAANKELRKSEKNLPQKLLIYVNEVEDEEAINKENEEASKQVIDIEEIQLRTTVLETRTSENFLSIGSENYNTLSLSNSSIYSNDSGKSGSSDQSACVEEVLKKEKKAYLVAKELMSSEKVYVSVLKLLNITFKDFAQSHQQKSVFSNLSEIDFTKIFSNLSDLLILNESMLNDFIERVKPENWNEKRKISDVIVKKGPFLKIYSTYISKFSDINKHFENCCNKNPKFDKIVKEFEALPLCQNLKLQHYLLKPVQRLPQYKLLLQDYLKQQLCNGADYEDTVRALSIVSNVADHANEQVKQEDKIKHLLQLQSRLGNIELLKPGRYLIKEGEVQKISRRNSISTIYLVLLSDCLLYTKYQNSWAVYSSSLWVAHTIDVSQMEISGDLSETDIFIKNNIKNFTFRTRSVEEKDDWLQALNIATEGFRKRSSSFSLNK